VKHARLSASAAHRWLACPGSVKLSEGLPDSGSVYADLGTMAHSVAAYCLKKRCDANSILDEERLYQPIQEYLDFCRREQTLGDQVGIEIDLAPALQKVDPDCGGMADFVRWCPSDGELLVADFKFGTGVTVEVEGNKQLKKYALGALLHYNAKARTVRAVVVQPRLENIDHRITSYEFPAFDLLDFAGDIKIAAEQSRLPNPPIVPGEAQCRWCPAGKAGLCDKMVKYKPRRPVAAAVTPEMFEVLNP
jgi:hypothetical protein